MALTSGAKLGPYEILAPLGAGGMEEGIERGTRDSGDATFRRGFVGS